MSPSRRPFPATALVIGIFVVGLFSAAGCNPNTVGVGDGGVLGGGDGPAGLTGLIVTPAEQSVIVGPGAPASPPAHFIAKSLSGQDVTASVTWGLDNAAFGTVSAGTYQPAAGLAIGGTVNVLASSGNLEGKAVLHIKFVGADIIDPSAPPGATGSFAGPTTGPAPQIVYPLTGAMLAKNINQMRPMWQSDPSQKIFRLTVDSPTYQRSVYLGSAACTGVQCGYAVANADWSNVAQSNAGSQVTMTVSGTAAAGQPVGSATPVTLNFSPQDVQGGLYYFSTSKLGLMRLPFGATAAVPFLLGNGNSASVDQCIGCHGVSRDGKKVAALFYDPDGFAGIVNGADATQYLLTPTPNTSGQLWNFASFSPDGSKLITVWKGVLTLRDGTTGAAITTVSATQLGGRVSMPEWSPDGNSIVFVRLPANGLLGSDFGSKTGASYIAGDWILGNAGDIAVVPYNNGNFGPSITVVPSSSGVEYHFYPSFSPDSQWIVFNSAKVASCASDTAASQTSLNVNQAQCVSYDQTAARLRLARNAANQTPIELTAATHLANKTTAWPKFAPFQQGNLVFFTFSSKFDYGWVVQQASVKAQSGEYRPQIWMSGIDLGKAAAGTGDPSFAPFWLPFQDSTTSNHEVLWTEDIACTTNSDCSGSGEFNCVNGMCVPVLG